MHAQYQFCIIVARTKKDENYFKLQQFKNCEMGQLLIIIPEYQKYIIK